MQETKANKLYRLLDKHAVHVPMIVLSSIISNNPKVKYLKTQLPFNSSSLYVEFILSTGCHTVSITIRRYSAGTIIEETIMDVYSSEEKEFKDEIFKDLTDSFIELMSNSKSK